MAGSWPNGNIMLPAELFSIDTKIDDGMPGLGSVTSTINTYGGHTSCTTGVTSTAEYNISDSDKECMALFAIQ